MNKSDPTITLVVPNYNGADTLAATLDCLIKQRLELAEPDDCQIIVMDGGSTDASVQIIRQREASLAFWVSEPDRGQAHAINKGFARATGEVVAWLNSDDLLAPGAIARARAYFAASPGVDVLVGDCRVVQPGRQPPELVWRARPADLELLPCKVPFGQPGTFMRRAALRPDKPVDEGLHYAFDFELWCDLHARGKRFGFIEQEMGVWFNHVNTKTSTGGWKIIGEMERVYRRYSPGERIPLTWWYRRTRLPLQRLLRRLPAGVATLGRRLIDSPLVSVLGWFYGGRRRVKSLDWTWCV